MRLSKNYDAFLHIKNTFIKNYAAICIATYILGIGDRHLDNFCVHSSSASLVMIDFGYSFGSSIDIQIP
jgi:Phosphatidylinositol kinase and protein kinases of the PI-3 kinase family